MTVNRTFGIHGHFECELDMPRSWPDEAVYEMRIQFVGHDGSVVFIHPDYAPVMYDYRKEKYKRVTFNVFTGEVGDLQ